ncbi:MFS transporter, ACDE family, multidrug resistance protein [Lentibacillus halodurans]|uniref:MFS transporter, ACDE family, multidrug resistance protein n=1 Tax=Lentibacillus halodurans TaxID=237679 RepID=A0A1I0VXR3_9BACI|nr:MFS transporter [Lentibacillus halodurans]SFA81008.1 MFS transporter, ACDE family, multidrug resistance protein [Lentibacillus halodurans]
MVDHQKEQEKRWAVISLASIPLIMTLGNSMLIPILPVMEQELGISKLQSSYIITVYSVVAIFLIPVAGFLSDRFGRKRVIIPSLIITGAGGLVAGLASQLMSDPFLIILAGRILQGIGSSGAFPIVLPLVGDMFKDDKEASTTLGIIETSNTVGKVLSPILGAALAAIAWYLPFYSIPVFCAVSVLMVTFLIKNKGEEEKQTRFKEYIGFAKDVLTEHGRWLMAVFIIGAILMFVLFGFLFYLSSILEEKYDYKGIWKGILLAVPLLALSVASFITGKKIKDQLNVMKWVTFIGIILTGASVAVIPFMDHPVYLLTIFLVCGTGIGMALPCLDALITESLEKSVRGVITSIYSAMRFIGVAAGPPVIAVLMKGNISWMASVLAIFALVAGFLGYRNIKP